MANLALSACSKTAPFNGKFRNECLPMWFKNRIDAKILIAEFRREYNEVRPRSRLGQVKPVELKRKLSTTDRKQPSLKPQLVRRKPAGRTDG